MEILNINNDKQLLINVKTGKNVKFFYFVNAYDCIINDETKIGSFVEIQKGVTIGKNCKISSHAFICEGVHIEDKVFIGHGVIFTNDKYPLATNSDGSLKASKDWTLIETFVESGVSIGSGSTILCGIRIGKNALIGAGSVVTKDVLPNSTVVGNPAREIKKA